MSVFPYEWYLKDGYRPSNNLKVFSCFACGGGSTMGYKLAGFDVIGANEIDKKIGSVYLENHKPKYFFNEDIRDFKARKDLPKEILSLDILDGSPPCSVFSSAGKREEGWGIEKTFREGQAKQRLDDLFFEFISLAATLKPKVIVAENVKGLLLGNAKIYLKKIKEAFNQIGYSVQIFLLNAATMGVPQARERVFFIAKREDLNLPNLNLQFNEKVINFKEISDEGDKTSNLTKLYLENWHKAKEGEPVGKFETCKKQRYNAPLFTITAHNMGSFHPKYPRVLNKKELCLGGSFPLDYNFLDVVPKYLIGMSVPPVMIAQIASKIYNQWFKL